MLGSSKEIFSLKMLFKARLKLGNCYCPYRERSVVQIISANVKYHVLPLCYLKDFYVPENNSVKLFSNSEKQAAALGLSLSGH